MSKLITLILILLAPLPALSVQYPPATVEMTLKPVSERVYYAQGKAGIATDNQGFISNAAAIITEEGIVVVDALGSPSLAALFLEKLREITPEPVTQVIVTHYHADHIYGLQVFKELGAEIIAPAGYDAYLDSPAAEERLEERRLSLAPWVNDETRLVVPDRVLDKSLILSVGGVELEITYLGAAHSDGDLSVLVRPDQVLISGDIIFEGRLPFTGGADTAHWLAVLEGLNKQGVRALIPGHGPAAEKPAESVRLTLDYLRFLRQQMAAAVEEMTPFDEVYATIDWSRFSHLPAFKATNRRNAYGVYLSLEQELLSQ
jgi:glyoxylase-like metal-dependent hydrolase (beta-lactamase superfamily II)